MDKTKQLIEKALQCLSVNTYEGRILAIGYLVHAEYESANKHIGLANSIREDRLKLMNNKTYIPDLKRFFTIIENLSQKS